MCGGCAPATGINSPPEGGVHGPPARFACAVPAAPRALPGRGLAPPDPQGCAPWCAFAHRAPAASVIQPEGFRARVRRWRGWASRRLVHARRLAPPPLPWIQFFKRWAVRMHGGGFGGRAPRCRAAVGNPAQAVGGQGAAACGCARRPRTGRGCPRATGFRAHATHRVRREWPQTRASAQASLPTCNSNRATLQQ